MLDPLTDPQTLTYPYYSEYKRIKNAIARNMQENNHFSNNIALKYFIVANPTPTSKHFCTV